jgi:cobalt-zinc-cadmium resistance protein CzcA
LSYPIRSLSSRAGARRSIDFAYFFGFGVAGLLLADDASPRRLTLADALVLAERSGQGVERGFRPVLMASLVAMLGLLPAALSNAIGAQAQKPLAVVVIGGALFVAFLTHLVRPPMLLLARRWFPGSEKV